VYKNWEPFLIIPEPEAPGRAYPGGVAPGVYNIQELVDLLRDHADDPAATYFIADMLEP
jgi:hypothetical protein